MTWFWKEVVLNVYSGSHGPPARGFQSTVTEKSVHHNGGEVHLENLLYNGVGTQEHD